MKYDATLKKNFQQPPNRLLSYALGKDVTVARILPTDLITVENLHPDMLFEDVDGTLIHAELHGYGMKGFPCRNLGYFWLVLRDYDRPPVQVVFWIGPGPVGVADGLNFPPALAYRYIVIDVRDIDAEVLLDTGEVEESIFAVLCKSADKRDTVARILRRIGQLPVEKQREAVTQLLVLSGLRGLKSLVKEEVKRMPVTIDIHENEFLEEIYQEGEQKGRLANAREMLLEQIDVKFGPVPAAFKQRIETSDLATVQLWGRRLMKAATLDEIFA